MNDLIAKLAFGDPRTYEDSDEVANRVLKNPELMGQLAEGLSHRDDLIRVKTAHAVERISNVRPDLVKDFTPTIIECAQTDPIPFIRIHMVMILGNIPYDEQEANDVIAVLTHLLEMDDSTFVRSWSIVSLTYIGKRNTQKRPEIIKTISAYRGHESAIISNRVERALEILREEVGQDLFNKT